MRSVGKLMDLEGNSIYTKSEVPKGWFIKLFIIGSLYL